MKTVSKYRGVRTVMADGSQAASKMEARRLGELQLLERAGLIEGLRTQVRYELVPAVRFKGAKRVTPAMVYVADAVYRDCDTGQTVVEDCKGLHTRVYLMKKHLMKALLGLDILESRPRA